MKPLNKTTIKYTDKNGTNRTVNVVVQKETFKFTDGAIEKELNYIIPYGIKVKRFALRGELGKDPCLEGTAIDVTGGYYFDYSDMELIPRDKKEYINSSYTYESYRNIFRIYSETFREINFLVTVDADCDFYLKGYKCIEHDYVDMDRRHLPKTLSGDVEKGLWSFLVRAASHKMNCLTNEANLKVVKFALNQ